VHECLVVNRDIIVWESQSNARGNARERIGPTSVRRVREWYLEELGFNYYTFRRKPFDLSVVEGPGAGFSVNTSSRASGPMTPRISIRILCRKRVFRTRGGSTPAAVAWSQAGVFLSFFDKSCTRHV